MKNYPPEFKRDAVALYESRPGSTIVGVAADLGVSSETLRNWIRAARKQRGESGRSGRRPKGRQSSGEASPETVEAENAELRRRVRELEEERDTVADDGHISRRSVLGGVDLWSPDQSEGGAW